MDEVRSINPVVGETNDGYLSDIRARPLGAPEVRQAIESAGDGPVAMGTVGAGTGTVCFDFKGGIGSASRRLDEDKGGWTVGVLVQTNFGGPLRISGLPSWIDGKPLGVFLEEHTSSLEETPNPDGSLMIVIATDAPLTHRNLRRLAQRSLYGMARTGGYGSNGSGDYAIAFSTHEAGGSGVTPIRRSPPDRFSITRPRLGSFSLPSRRRKRPSSTACSRPRPPRDFAAPCRPCRWRRSWSWRVSQTRLPTRP